MYKTKKGARQTKFTRDLQNRFADTLLWILSNEKVATAKLSQGFPSAKTEMEYLNAFRYAQQIRFLAAIGEEVEVAQYKGREKEFKAVIARIKAEGQQTRIFNQ